jgi:ankyrin repeat protein
LKGKETVPPLTWASRYGYTEIVKLLIDAKAKVNVEEASSPIVSASFDGHIETMKVLLKAGADINQKGYEGKTALMLAAGRGKVELVKFLLENGADVNLKDRYNEVTALSWAMKGAAASPNPQINEVIQLLKNAGAIE